MIVCNEKDYEILQLYSHGWSRGPNSYSSNAKISITRPDIFLSTWVLI